MSTILMFMLYLGQTCSRDNKPDKHINMAAFFVLFTGYMAVISLFSLVKVCHQLYNPQTPV